MSKLVGLHIIKNLLADLLISKNICQYTEMVFTIVLISSSEITLIISLIKLWSISKPKASFAQLTASSLHP